MLLSRELSTFTSMKLDLSLRMLDLEKCQKLSVNIFSRIENDFTPTGMFISHISF